MVPRVDPPGSQEFPRRLRDALTASQQSIAEVARAAGLGGRQSLHPYLTGRVEPTIQRVEQFARLLRVDPRWLAGWQDKGGPLRGTRCPLTDREWEQALRAHYRHAVRRGLDALPTDAKDRRAICRKADKTASGAAYYALRRGENLEGVDVAIPARKRSYRVGKVVMLRNAGGEVARIRAYPQLYSGERMRVISNRD